MAIPSSISRRAWLASAAATLACSRRKTLGFPGYCFVANHDSRTVAAVDLTRFRVRKHIALDEAPGLVLPHPTRSRVFVLAPSAGMVYEIDSETLAVARRIRAGSEAVGMQLSPAMDALWVLCRNPNALVELPLQSLQPARRIRLNATPDTFDLSRDGVAAIASSQDSSIAMASLSDASVAHTIQAGVEPSILRFRGDGQALLVGSRAARSLGVFDVPTGKVVVRLPLPVEPRHFCFNHDLGQLFISGDGMDAVAIVYPYRTEVVETMLAGHAPDAMCCTVRPPFLLVANPDSNSVTVLNFDNMGKKLVTVVQVGQEPRQILVTEGQPEQQFALVLNAKSGDLAVIRISALASTDPKRRWKPTPVFTLVPVGERPVSAAVARFAD